MGLEVYKGGAGEFDDEGGATEDEANLEISQEEKEKLRSEIAAMRLATNAPLSSEEIEVVINGPRRHFVEVQVNPDANEEEKKKKAAAFAENGEIRWYEKEGVERYKNDLLVPFQIDSRIARLLSHIGEESEENKERERLFTPVNPEAKKEFVAPYLVDTGKDDKNIVHSLILRALMAVNSDPNVSRQMLSLAQEVWDKKKSWQDARAEADVLEASLEPKRIPRVEEQETATGEGREAA